MGLLSRFWRTRPVLAPAHTGRLQALSELTPPPVRNAHRHSRYVTVDVETTGLDMHRDRLLSIGAVAVTGERIALAGCFHVVLRQTEASSTGNILVHRIGGQRQLAGDEPVEALLRFLEFAAHCPLVAYRAEFDRTVLDRALDEHLGIRSTSRWLDLAELLPALYPGNEHRTMDDWLGAMGIRMIERHDALADALATAQMLQVCLKQAESLAMRCPAHLLEMQSAQHWLGKR